jgi:hypothetical protein
MRDRSITPSAAWSGESAAAHLAGWGAVHPGDGVQGAVCLGFCVLGASWFGVTLY